MIPGLPKSCQGIRDAGIGNIDGQYIIEARENCHISVICVNMDDEDTKEFLGGPSEEEWRYWHYAVLIKISDADKKNLPTGACLESSGKNLISSVEKCNWLSRRLYKRIEIVSFFLRTKTFVSLYNVSKNRHESYIVDSSGEFR